MTDGDERKIYFDIWSKAVDTQMHFNEMSVKSRQFGLAFVAAALGVAVVLLSQGKDFAISHTFGSIAVSVHVASLVAFASAFAMVAVRKLDLGVYHKMLRGAVTFGEDFEENYMKKMFNLEKGMTQAISHFSRYTDASATSKDGRYAYTGSNRVTAEDKLKQFYRWTITVLVLSGVLLLLFTSNVSVLSTGS